MYYQKSVAYQWFQAPGDLFFGGPLYARSAYLGGNSEYGGAERRRTSSIARGAKPLAVQWLGGGAPGKF